MKNGLLIIILVLLVKTSFGQDFTDLYGDYLGQKQPGDTPVVFAPNIISGDKTEHSAAIFSSDNKQVFWISRKDTVMSIWFMNRINNRWTKPQIFTPFSEPIIGIDPFLSHADKRLYFSDGNKEDIMFIEKQNESWTKPQSISSIINKPNGQFQAIFTNDGTVYYIDTKIVAQKWSCDILKSKFKNGNYLTPDTLPDCINSKFEDWTPFIAKDESYLIFASNRQSKYCDLYISFHDIKNDTWSEPINMGELINTKSQETYPTVSPDGKYLFFTRYTDENNDMDVYWVSAKIIDKLKEKSKEKK